MPYAIVLDNASSFTPSAASEDLLRQLNDAISEINGYRPLSNIIIQRLQEQILYDRVHSSAVTEGNRLSKRETIVVLTTGIIEAGSRRDEIEVRNLANAMAQLEELIRTQTPISSYILRQLHYLIMVDIDDACAGKFRSEDVAISGAKVQPPSFLDVPDLIQKTLSSAVLFDETLHPLQKATWLHWAIARIHPFKDGNGRIARILQDYILLCSNFVPSPLQSEDREGGYYSALEAADLGDGRPLLEISGKNTIKIADRYLAIIREEEAKRDWVSKITQAATEKVRQTGHRKFLAVQRATNILRTEFYNLAINLNNNIPDVRITFRDYGSLEFEKFQEIEKWGSAKRTWLFGVEFSVEKTSLRYIFWYASHHTRPSDISSQLPSSVVILASVEEEKNYYRLLDDIEEDRVSLREIIPDQGMFWRRRYNPITETHEWDTNITGGTVARDFLEEVLSKLGII